MKNQSIAKRVAHKLKNQNKSDNKFEVSKRFDSHDDYSAEIDLEVLKEIVAKYSGRITDDEPYEPEDEPMQVFVVQGDNKLIQALKNIGWKVRRFEE